MLVLLAGATLVAILSVGCAAVFASAQGFPLTSAYLVNVLVTAAAVSLFVGAVLQVLLRDYRRKTIDMGAENTALAEALSLNQAILNTTRDGILVVNGQDRPVVFNRRFLELWRIPETLAERARLDATFHSAEFRAAVLHLLEDPDAYLRRVAALLRDPEAIATDTLFFKDGQRLRRFSSPQRVNNRIVGRIWTYQDITELHHEKERLDVFKQLIDGSHDSLIIVDPITSEILDCNARAAELHGYSREELLAYRLVDINIGIRDTVAWHNAVAKMEKEGPLLRVVDHIRSDGKVFPLEVLARPVTAGGKRYVVAIERDISERHEMEIALTRERDLARLIFDMQRTLLAILQDETIIACNEAMSEMLGQPPMPEINQPLDVILNRLIEQPGYLDRIGIRAWLAEAAEMTGAQQHLLLRFAPTGEVHTFLAYRRRLPSPDTRQLLALTDITELEEKRREIEHLAATDGLTGLLNRARFNEVLEQQLYMVHRYHVNFSLAMFDVDRFKAINDNKGHLVGDRVLAEIGQLLNSRLRGGDTAARWGGDEFMVLMPETDLAGARAVITDVRDALTGWDFHLGEPLSCSFGITTALKDDTAQSLIGRVDTAMYNAKRAPGSEKIAVALTPAG